MPEALVRLSVAIADLVVRVVFGAVVVCELDNALAIGPMFAVRGGFRAIVCEEVEVELSVGVLDLYIRESADASQAHASQTGFSSGTYH
jgi:hypothetical protein